MVRLAGKHGKGWTPTGPRSGATVKTPDDYARFVASIEPGLRERNMSNDIFHVRLQIWPHGARL